MSKERDGNPLGRVDQLPRAVYHHFGLAAPASPSSDGSRPASWPTPSAMDGQRPDETPAEWEQRNAEKKAANPNLGQLHRPLTIAVQNWPTPTANNPNEGETMESWNRRQALNKAKHGNGNGAGTPLAIKVQMQNWATPEAKNQVGYQVGQDGTRWPRLGSQVQAWATPQTMDTLPQRSAEALARAKKKGGCCNLREQVESGKLNPRWVETLMGLPVGWTMPSCASPVIPESTSFACLETASCPPSPSEPL